MSLPLMAAGEFARVTPVLEQALKTPSEWIGDHILTAALADAAAQQRQEPALRKYAPLAEALAQDCGHRLNQAVAHRAWGVAHRLAGEYAESEARLKSALAMFEPLNTRWQIGRTLFELGELAAIREQPGTARGYFGDALVNFDAMRAAPDSARTRAALEALD
jgi:tetratricopeptide (TPR) repeat protein